MKTLLIFGTGLIAELAHFYFERDTDYRVAGFTNGTEFIKETSFKGLPVVPFDEVERRFPPGRHAMFVAIGYAMTNQVRERRYFECKQKGYLLATYISPKATYYGTPVGDNCFILENNVIQPFVTIGSNVTLWSGNHIGHHSIIKDHCFISSHVVISGSCCIEENCFLGVNSTLRDNINIGKMTIIGSGAVVMKNCEGRSLVRPPQSAYTIVDRDLV